MTARKPRGYRWPNGVVTKYRPPTYRAASDYHWKNVRFPALQKEYLRRAALAKWEHVREERIAA